MINLKVPSVQHLARNWYDSPQKIEKRFVSMAMNPPQFNYNILNEIARDCLLFDTPEEQIIKGIKEKEKRKIVQHALLEIIPLMCKHFSVIQPDYVHDVAPSYYPIGRDLLVPFKSVFIYGIGGVVYLPWFIFWKRNPLNDKQLSLFVTLVKEILRQDPELEAAKFEILDFSARNAKECRQLKVIDTADIPTFDSSTTENMLTIFIEGFESAVAKLQKVDVSRKAEETGIDINVNQLPLWS